HLFIRLAAIGSLKNSGAKRAFFHQLADRLYILRANSVGAAEFRDGRSHLHQNDLQIGLAFGANGEPTETVGHGLIHLHVKAQLVYIKVFGHVLVDHKNGRVRHALNHLCSLYWRCKRDRFGKTQTWLMPGKVFAISTEKRLAEVTIPG